MKQKLLDEVKVILTIQRKDKKDLRAELILRIDDDEIKSICIEQLPTLEDIALSN